MASKIEWTDETWNPVTGCSKVSEGCRNCYAEGMAARFAGQWGYEHKPWTAAHAEHNVRTHSDRLDIPLRWKKPRRVFVNSMSDLFHEEVPFEFIEEVFETMHNAHQHTFQVLTKRPARMLEFFEWYIIRGLDPAGERMWEPSPNIWIGVSVENQQAADERIPLLLQTPAAVRFLSCEPLLGMVDLSQHLPNNPRLFSERNGYKGTIDWVIAGGESGPNARPMHPDWVQSLRDQCEAARVPFFFKQWGEWGDNTDGKYMKYEVEDYIFTASGEMLGAGHGKYGGGVQGDWRERGGAWMSKVGKKLAGRELDGRTHDDFPDAR